MEAPASCCIFYSETCDATGCSSIKCAIIATMPQINGKISMAECLKLDSSCDFTRATAAAACGSTMSAINVNKLISTMLAQQA